ncbi:unnamed protein product [Nesidiocoris tenuis]|uniref:C2H2-type domain-containing protein n=1 Tax=Nesidiocoris tenuis TaxID=355587 RepID=A0A6H5FXS7_9HEMI|nr:unnamed protein product [Nesidiocoris tenuis]
MVTREGRRISRSVWCPHWCPNWFLVYCGFTVCGARYKTRPGLTYHYTHSHKDGGSGGGGRGGGGGSGGLPPPSSTTPPSSSSCSSSSGGGSIMMSTMVGGSVDDELASTAAGPPHELQPPPPMQTTGQALPPSQPPGGGQDGGLHPPPPQPQSWPPFPGQQDSYLSYLNATPDILGLPRTEDKLIKISPRKFGNLNRKFWIFGSFLAKFNSS